MDRENTGAGSTGKMALVSNVEWRIFSLNVGVADNYMSACSSCHSTAQRDSFMNGNADDSASRMATSFNDDRSGNPIIAEGSSEWMRW